MDIEFEGGEEEEEWDGELWDGEGRDQRLKKASVAGRKEILDGKVGLSQLQSFRTRELGSDLGDSICADGDFWTFHFHDAGGEALALILECQENESQHFFSPSLSHSIKQVKQISQRSDLTMTRKQQIYLV